MRRIMRKHAALLIAVILMLGSSLDALAEEYEAEGETLLEEGVEPYEEEPGEFDGESESPESDVDTESEPEPEPEPDPMPGTDIDIKNFVVPMENPVRDIVSVVLPIVEDRDVFSFFIDPHNFLYNSFANSEDITVEEGANLLFINRSDDRVGLSSVSDRLSIINQSTVPVDVTITATLNSIDGINLMQSSDFADRQTCDLYLALVDDEGNEQAIAEDGTASVTVRLDKAPLEAYAYEYDEESGEYRYAYQCREIAFDTYSFGLKGACNKEGNWSLLSGQPKVLISWNVEPVMGETDVSDTEREGAAAQNADQLREVESVEPAPVSEPDGESDIWEEAGDIPEDDMIGSGSEEVFFPDESSQ